VAHWMLKPLFDYVQTDYDEFEYSGLSVEIDDCDCEDCEESRGPISQYATIMLGIHTNHGIVHQRLTPKEAEQIAQRLKSYARVIRQLEKSKQKTQEDQA
jgi:hypothetical protein